MTSENTYRSSELETFSPAYSKPQKVSRTVSLAGVQIKTKSTAIYFVMIELKSGQILLSKMPGLMN